MCSCKQQQWQDCGWQSLYHSLQVRCTTEAGLRIRVCWRSTPYITQGQPCSWDHQLAVELWQAPASSLRAFCRKNGNDLQTVPVWNLQARLGDLKGQQRSRSKNMTCIYLVCTRYLPEIYNCWVKLAFYWMMQCPPPRQWLWLVHASFETRMLLLVQYFSNGSQASKNQTYTKHVYGIY